jgi:hypothetical protein
MLDDLDVDELVTEAERSLALGQLDALIALCTRAEAERALTEAYTGSTGASEHARQYGHRLDFGCCLRACDAGLPSLIDGVE